LLRGLQLRRVGRGFAATSCATRRGHTRGYVLTTINIRILDVLSHLDCTTDWRRSSSERPWKNASKFMHRTVRSAKNLKRYYFHVLLCVYLCKLFTAVHSRLLHVPFCFISSGLCTVYSLSSLSFIGSNQLAQFCYTVKHYC